MKAAALVCAAFSLFCVLPAASGFERTDPEVKEEMIRRSSLFCPGFSKERGLPGINAVRVEALRVLLDHNFSLCPDRRLGDNIGAVWNSRWGVLLWNPTNSKAIPVLAGRANAMTHSLDFPNELSVYDLDGKPLKNQIIPMFEPRDTFTRF